MSVLRKRSSWMLPAAVLGILTMGLAGCGGDDDEDVILPPIDTITLPFTLTPVQAQGSQSFPSGGGGTVEVSNLNAANFGGVISGRVTFPTGTTSQNQTFGVAIIPANEATLTRLQNANPNAFQGRLRNWSNVFEIVIGPVLPDGTIDWQNAPANELNFEVELTEAQANFLGNQLNGNRLLRVFRVNTNNVATRDDHCEIQFVRQNRRVIVTKCRGGRAFVVHIPREHDQGQGHSG